MPLAHYVQKHNQVVEAMRGAWAPGKPFFPLALWLGFQVLSVWLGGGGHVAWWAHIGGFVIGVVIALALKASHFTKPPVQKTLPNTDRVSVYRIYPHRR